MSLPRGFATDAAYFGAAVDFLHRYAWIYRESNTSCLKSLDEMPGYMKQYFLELSNEQLNRFPFVHEALEDCPEEVLRFRQEIANLTPTEAAAPAAGESPRKSKRNNCKMSIKKLHEIDKLASHIHEHCPDTEGIIDLGSGLGYLSEALLQLSDNYQILGLEAEEQRIQTARERTTNCNSISYEQLLITADASCCARIQEHAAALGLERAPTAIVGLHACADLSISAMLLFLRMPQVRCLHIMPCCYHKLALSEDGESFVNFPLSRALREAMSAVAAPARCFHRPFLRLACQQTKSRWQSDARTHVAHGSQMFQRAVAAALCDEQESSRVRRQGRPATDCQDPHTFASIQQKYQLHSRETGLGLDWRPVHERRFDAINQVYGNGCGARLSEALTCLQASIQLLCENVLLYDRLCYLQELAAVQQLELAVRYEKLFDEKLSPRCHVLIAQKL
ncbi:hypothetical protein AWZ03_008859 [Drosophila navojoa]|uniref:Methyltransferase domain-containing protein n=1 Tax=Drosophila navojoa TaxID=7232 RepID=A0A484B7Q1_DRONA|nr:uncharacterized protein LOC108652799 [Drosophila navojoa]TDG44718.1 hypothetical protein AWZ03_008859 [Drosophila navojoa]